MVSLKYRSNFWRTFEMPLINCEIALMLTWSKDCFLVTGIAANQEQTFKVTRAKLYVPVLTLSIQDDVLSFESGNVREVYKKYFFLTVEKKTSRL